MKKNILFLFVFIMTNVCAQTRRDSFLIYLENINEKNKYVKTVFKNLEIDCYWMYDCVLPFIENNKNSERACMYYLVLWTLAYVSEDDILQIKTLNRFIDGSWSRNETVKDYCIKGLKSFKKQLFNDFEKRKIAKLLHDTTTHSFDLILLCGFLDLKKEVKFIKNKFINNSGIAKQRFESYFYENEWAAYLALARMGNKESIQFVSEKYQSEKNLIIKCNLLGPQLDYVKQNITHQLLIGTFISNLKLPPESENEDGRLCGLYYIYFLAKSVKNYPFKVKKGYSPKDVMDARAWFATRPKIIINRDIF